HHGMGSGVAHTETLAGATSGKELAACGTIQAGIADDRRFPGFETAALGRLDNNLAAGHTLADVVVRITGEIDLQPPRIPYPEGLPGNAGQIDMDGPVRHTLVAVAPGNFATDARSD